MTWTAIGAIITFNVVFNHLMAMLIKPGGPTDLAVSTFSLTKSERREIALVLQGEKDKKGDEVPINA
jgi:hypothetical protein